MKLVDSQIREEILNHHIVEPYEDNLIQPASLDVRLGRFFRWYTGTGMIDVKDEKSLTKELIGEETAEFILSPGAFVLAETREKFNLPKNIYAELHGKSSLARLGLSIHQTGGLIDNGFSGTITLELKNENNTPIKIYAGMTIGQVTFEYTWECEVGYNEKKDAKYQGQKDAEPSRYRLDLCQ